MVSHLIEMETLNITLKLEKEHLERENRTKEKCIDALVLAHKARSKDQRKLNKIKKLKQYQTEFSNEYSDSTQCKFPGLTGNKNFTFSSKKQSQKESNRYTPSIQLESPQNFQDYEEMKSSNGH